MTISCEGNIKSHAEFIVWYSSYFSNAKCTSFKEQFRVCMTLFRNRSKTIFLERKRKSLPKNVEQYYNSFKREEMHSCDKGYGGCVLNISNMITAHKRSLGQGNVFSSVCHSVHREREGGLPNPPRMQTPPDAYPPRVRQTPLDADPLGLGRCPRGWADPPGCRPPRCTPLSGVGQIPPGCRPPRLGRLP